MSTSALVRRVAASTAAVLAISAVTVAVGAVTGPNSGSAHNRDNRADVHAAFKAEMSRTELASGFTGNLADCEAGTTSVEFQLQQVERINYYRGLAGLKHEVVLDESMSDEAQEAALIIAANAAVDHNPSADVNCFSQKGATGSAFSNLYQRTGDDALRGFMEDPGEHNVSVGHRNWLLMPQLRSVGIGEIPTSDGSDIDGGYAVNFQNGFELEHDASVVSWPAPGYFPEELVDERWSLSIHGADFSNAEVTVIRNGEVVDAPIVFNENRPGVLPSAIITFTPEGIDAFEDGEDTVYEIAVDNVVSDAGTTFEYEVTTFDADAPLTA